MPKHDTRYYQIPSGKLLWKEDSTPQKSGYEDLGNIKEMEITEEVELVDHYESRTRLKSRDMVVEKSVKASGTFKLDSLSFENMQKYFLAGNIIDTVQAAASATLKDVLGVQKDRWHEIDLINISNVVVKDATEVTTYVEDTDYEIDYDAGLIYIIEGGAIASDDDLKVTVDNAAATIREMIAAAVKAKRGHVYFIADPLVGEVIDLKGWILLTPDGSFGGIKDEFNEIGFKMDFLKHNDYKPGLFKSRSRGNVAD